MDNARKQQIKLQYKQRKVIGGIYRIVNIQNGKFLLAKTSDLHGAESLFQSSYNNGQPSQPRLRKDWDIYGKDSFKYEVLEEWEKGQEETYEDFTQDIMELYNSWDEKLPKEPRY